MSDSHDLVIDMLADSEAALMDGLVDLVIERDAYRLVAQQAIHALHDLARERDRLRAAHDRLIDEYRTLRARIVQREIAA